MINVVILILLFITILACAVLGVDLFGDINKNKKGKRK